MLQHTAASVAAASRRLHPAHVLGAALALVCATFVLHSQYQVYSQLSAANKELQELKSLLGHPHQVPGAWHAGSSTPAGAASSTGGGDAAHAADDEEQAGDAAAGSLRAQPPKAPFWRAEQRQQQLQQLGAQGNSSSCNVPGTLCLDMTEMLGLSQFMNGITWEPKVCARYCALWRRCTSALHLHDSERRQHAPVPDAWCPLTPTH